MPQPQDGDKLGKMLDFIVNAPIDEEIIKMDCNDSCEKIAQLAEQVANGADLNDIVPELQKFMNYWGDCREEFEALVAVIRAEKVMEDFDFSEFDKQSDSDKKDD
jgi:aspartyl/asparaginyl beta-hydroxylase (cupin superfamily)